MRKEVGGLGLDSLHCFKGSLLSYFMVSTGIASMDEVTRLPTIRQLESGNQAPIVLACGQAK